MFKCEGSGWLSDTDDVLFHAASIMNSIVNKTGDGFVLGMGECPNCKIMGVSVKYAEVGETEDKEYIFSAPAALEIGRKLMDVGMGQKDVQFIGAMLQVLSLGIITSAAQEGTTKCGGMGYNEKVRDVFDAFDAIKNHADARGTGSAGRDEETKPDKGDKDDRFGPAFGDVTIKSLARKLSRVQKQSGKAAAMKIFEAIKSASTANVEEEAYDQTKKLAAKHGITTVANPMSEERLEAVAKYIEANDRGSIFEEGRSVIALSTATYPVDVTHMKKPSEITKALKGVTASALYAVELDAENGSVNHVPLGVFEFGKAFGQFTDDLERYLIDTMTVTPETSRWLNMLRAAGCAFARKPETADDMKEMSAAGRKVVDDITAAAEKGGDFHVSLDSDGRPVVMSTEGPDEERTLN